jgi:hypothetical protein
MPKKIKALEPHQNREAWLNEIATKLVPRIEEIAQKKMPPVRIAMGFPSRQALSVKHRRLGECWSGKVAKDGVHEIMISPLVPNPMETVGVVAHEQVHAIVGTHVGHKGEFVRVIRALGLAGKPTATVPGKAFIEFVSPLIKEMEYEFPHSQLIPGFGGHKPQPTRLLKASCLQCGYVVRVTKKWVVESGTPICPTHKTPMHCSADLGED